MAIRMRELRYSVPAALQAALQRGLPFAAIIAATVPVWGMSWYFDTENWAAGMWNSWAESRTDTWRAAMVRAVLAPQGGVAGATSFAVDPGVGPGDFSFVVIGDTGEGDASQHVLRDQLLTVANSPDVRFVVISSDVVYPSGAMQRLRSEVLAAFQGRHTAGLCDSWQSRLVRRARSLQRDVSPGRRRACKHTSPRGVRSRA